MLYQQKSLTPIQEMFIRLMTNHILGAALNLLDAEDSSLGKKALLEMNLWY